MLQLFVLGVKVLNVTRAEKLRIKVDVIRGENGAQMRLQS
jgi:hypothetical protein